MNPTIFMALIAMLFSPCIAYTNNMPRPLLPAPPNHHYQGHAIPPMLYEVFSPTPPPAPPTSTVPPPVHTSHSPPPPSRTHPVFPNPIPRHPIPRPRLPLSPPLVSGVPLPPSLNPRNPTSAPPTDAHSSVPIYATAPAQPPMVPHHQFPPFSPRHQFLPHRQFPPRHGGVPTPATN